jgi:hypothetical protein
VDYNKLIFIPRECTDVKVRLDRIVNKYVCYYAGDIKRGNIYFKRFPVCNIKQTVSTVAPATDRFAKFIFLHAINEHEPSWGSFLLVCHRISRKSRLETKEQIEESLNAFDRSYEVSIVNGIPLQPW